jgi:hypothetical protein
LIAINVKIKKNNVKKKRKNEDQKQCYISISEEVQRAQALCNVDNKKTKDDE